MEISKVFHVWFSPTGGTVKAGSLITAAWGDCCVSLNITDYGKEKDTYRFSREDAVYVSVPSYGGRVPETAVKRLSQMKGENTAAVIVAAYGNRDYDDTLAELKQLMEENGFCVIGAVAAVTEHSIVRQYGAGRPDDSDTETLTSFGRMLKDEILAWDGGFKDVRVKGKEPFKEYHGVPVKPEAGKTCTGCGHCVDLCPVHAIDRENPREMDKAVCISCMRCVQICPSHARNVNKLILSATALKLKAVCSGRRENELFVDNQR